MRIPSLLVVLLATGCAAPPLPQSSTEVRSVSPGTPPAPLPLGPNDILQLSVPGRPEFATEAGYRISPAGSIVLPIVGEVAVGGRSIEEAKLILESALSEYVRDPRIGLSVLEFGAHHVYVLGQVGRPGALVLDRNQTVLAILARAQGLREGARRDHVALLRRHGPEEVEVYFFNAEIPGVAALVHVRPDDVIFVPRSGSGVFRDEALPILQGIGFTTGQIAAVAVIADQF